MTAMRAPRFLHWMTRLALAAVLLLAVMPTLSRWLDSRHVAPAEVAMAMCTGAGMTMLSGHRGHAPAPDAASMSHPEPSPMPMGGMHDGDVCAYCPLLTSLLPVLLVLALVLPPLRRIRLPSWATPAQAAQPCLSGLGARGPPILL